MPKLVDVIWNEAGHVSKLTCEIIGEDKDFLIVKTLTKEMKISKSVIIKIEKKIEGEDDIHKNP